MLFDLPLLPGLKLREEFVSRSEEVEFIDHIAGLHLTPFQFQGFEGKRLTTSFGWSYDFQQQRLAPASPMPAWLLPLRDRAAGFAGLMPADLVQALVIRYDPDAGIGWHRDRPVFEHVIGISLGAPTTLRFRRRKGERQFDRAAVQLAGRSAYHLSGAVRHQWEHGIAAHDALRFSITFRSFARGRTG